MEKQLKTLIEKRFMSKFSEKMLYLMSEAFMNVMLSHMVKLKYQYSNFFLKI